MTGTKRTAYGAAASRIGVSTAEYERRRANGERWCSRCRVWHDESAFGFDAAQGRRRICREGPWRVA